MINQFQIFHTVPTKKRIGSLQFRVNDSLVHVDSIVKKTRSSLEPHTLNMVVCLRSWLSYDI